LKNARLPVGLFADTDASGPPAHVVQERTPGSVWPKAMPANRSTAKVKVKMGSFRLVIASSSKRFPDFWDQLELSRTADRMGLVCQKWTGRFPQIQPYCRPNGARLPKVDGKDERSVALGTPAVDKRHPEQREKYSNSGFRVNEF